MSYCSSPSLLSFLLQPRWPPQGSHSCLAFILPQGRYTFSFVCSSFRLLSRFIVTFFSEAFHSGERTESSVAQTVFERLLLHVGIIGTQGHAWALRFYLPSLRLKPLHPHLLCLLYVCFHSAYRHLLYRILLLCLSLTSTQLHKG